MRGTPVRFVDFRGGINTNAAPYLINKNECRDCRNVVSTTRGSIKKRNGNATLQDVFTGSPASLESLFAASDGLIVTGGTSIFSVTSGGVVTEEITGLTDAEHWEFVEAPANGGEGPVYGMNGIDSPRFWTSTGVSGLWTASSGTLPNGKYCLYFKNRVFVAGVTGEEQTLYFSDLGDPRAWSDTGFVKFDPEDGEPITGLGTVGPYLLVFKRSKCYVVYDTDTGANRPLSGQIGCPAHRSIAEAPNGTYFLTDDAGVYFTNGTTLKRVSDNITPTLLSITPAERQFACGEFFGNHYYLSICTSGSTNNITLDYDTQIESWWVHDNTANQFAVWNPSPTDAAVLYAVSADSVVLEKLYQDGVNQDNGADFTAYWLGPWITFDEPYRRKRVRAMHFDGSGNLDVYLALDFASSPSLVASDIFPQSASGGTFGGSGDYGGDGIFGDAATQSEDKTFNLGVGRAFSLKLQSTSSTTMEIDAFTLMYTLRAN